MKTFCTCCTVLYIYTAVYYKSKVMEVIKKRLL